MQAPHARSGLTAAQYSLWLDTHGTEEVLTGVRQALEAAEHEWREGGAAEAGAVVLALC